MEQTQKQPTKKKPTKKPATTTTKSVEAPAQSDALAALASLSPEMIAQLVSLVQAQQAPAATPVAEVATKPKRLSKAYLNTIRDEEVEVRNLTPGIVVYTSQKTGATYKWMGKDEVEIMTIGEVMAMHSQSEKFLKTPWLIVENEDVMVSLGLSEIHQQVSDFEDIDELLSLSTYQIKTKLSALSPSYLAQIGEVIGAKVLNGELRDIYVIRELEEYFGRKFLI